MTRRASRHQTGRHLLGWLSGKKLTPGEKSPQGNIRGEGGSKNHEVLVVLTKLGSASELMQGVCESRGSGTQALAQQGI